MEQPLKFRWSLLIVFALWVLGFACFETGVVKWPEFTLIHTFLGPAVLLIALTPLSSKKVTAAKWLMPFMAGWAGVVIPAAYIPLRWGSGFGNHCDRASVLAGVLAFSMIAVSWLMKIVGNRSNRERASVFWNQAHA